MLQKKLILSLVLFYLVFQSVIAAASSTKTYFPLNNGDVKSYTFNYNGNPNQTMQLSYTSYPGKSGVFIEKDSVDGSQALYENRNGKLQMPGTFDSGQYIWFSQPLVVFSDTVIRNGGNQKSSVTATFQGVNIYISSETTVVKKNNITVPSGEYFNCRSISFKVKVEIEGSSQSIIMNNVWTLAPRVGKIEVEVADTNDNYVDTAELTSGKVAGIDVRDLAGRINLQGTIILLLGK